MKKGKIYIDMDDTICWYSKKAREFTAAYPSVPYPQSITGFFSELDWYPGAEEAWKKLEDAGYDLRICTRASPYNLNSYTEKAIWIRNNISFECLEKLNICPDKSLIGTEEDFLIDDYTIHGQDKFRGKLMHFGPQGEFKNWDAILEYFDL